MNMLFAKSSIKKNEGRKVSLVGYTGGIMEVAGIGIVAVDLAGLKLPEQVKICYDHNESIDGLIGTGKARIVDGQLLIEGELLPDNEVADKVLNMLREGVELECSIGAKIEKTEYIEPRRQVTVNGQALEHEQGFNLVTESTLRECSVCLLGADNQTSISLKGKSMPNILNEEKQRVSAILEAVADMPEHQRLAASAIKSGMTVDVFKSQLLSEIRASRNTCPTLSYPGLDKTIDRNILQAGFLLSCGHEQTAVRACGADATMKAKQAGLTNIVDVAKQTMVLAGETHIPTGSRNILRASFSTASMANILSGSVDKLLADTAAQIKDPWRPFSKVRVLNNYRSHSVLRAEINAALEETPPSGEVKVGALSETSFDSLQCKLFSKLIRISLQTLMSDDLSVFADMPEALIRAAKKSLNDNVFETLMANSNSFYSTGNGNYAEGANTALSVDAVGAAITLMRKMVDAQGMPMDIVPVALIVPSDLEQAAKQILNSSELARTGDNSPTGNPWNQSLVLVSEPRLSNANFTNYSTLAWYLAAANSMNVGFVGGEVPQVMTFGPDSEPGSIGYAWRIEYSYGSAMADPSSTIKMKGSA